LDRIIASIDVGTTKVCTLIGEVIGGDRLRVVGRGVVPSRGLQRGRIVDTAQATQAITASVEKAQKSCGVEVKRAYVGVAGGHISSINSRGVVPISRSVHTVTQQEVDRAIEAAQAIAIPHDRRIVHIIPRGFSLDGQDGIHDPLGLHGTRLEAEVHIITGSIAAIHNLVQCVQGAGVHISDLVLQPLASGEAVLTDTEREAGVVLADIGGGTTDIAIFINGSIWHTLIREVAGNHLTNDLVIGLHTPFGTAEEIKIKYGHALSRAVDPNEVVELQAFGDRPRLSVPCQHIALILEARAKDILELIIMGEVKKSGYDGLLPAGVVLTGGTAELPGLRELGEEMLNLPVRIGRPQNVEGLVEVTESPAYATGVGLLLWGMRYGQARPSAPPSFWQNVFGRFKGVLGAFLP